MKGGETVKKIGEISINPKRILFAFMLAYSIAPILSRAVSTFLTTYFYMLLVVLTLFIAIFSERQASFDQYVFLLIPFLAYQLLTYLTRTSSLVIWGYSIMLFILPVTMGYYLMNQGKKHSIKLSKALLFWIFVTIVTTIIGLIRYPLAARILATFDSSQDAELILYNWNNIGGYDFVYTLVLLYPLLILAFKQKRISGIVTAILSVSIGVVIVLSEYTIALLLFLMTSVLFLFRRKLSLGNMTAFIAIGLLMIIFFSDLFSGLLLWLADLFEDRAFFHERLTALAGGITGLESSESNRLELYRESVSNFLKNPIFGTMFSGRPSGGGHSQILDALSNYGLVGAALIVLMYRQMYVHFIRKHKTSDGYGYVIWFFIQSIFLSTINTGFWFEVLALYGPLILGLIYQNKEEINEDTLDSKYAYRTARRYSLR